jgi:hypothetical protein
MVNQRIIASNGSIDGHFLEQFEDTRAESIAYLKGKGSEEAP